MPQGWAARAANYNDDLVFAKFTAAALAEGGGVTGIILAGGTGSRSGQSSIADS